MLFTGWEAVEKIIFSGYSQNCDSKSALNTMIDYGIKNMEYEGCLN